MNTKELMQYIGKEADLSFRGFAVTTGQLVVRVRITDCKQAYGNTRMLVTPVAGSGQVWVDESRLSNISDAKWALVDKIASEVTK
jgi:hypothetical protein